MTYRPATPEEKRAFFFALEPQEREQVSGMCGIGDVFEITMEVEDEQCDAC